MEPCIWFIDGPENLDLKEFYSNYVNKLECILQEPETSIILTDRPGCSIQVARYFAKQKYRNCTIYHPGAKPRHNIGKFYTKGGFSSLDKCKKQMLKDSNKYFCPVEIKQNSI